VNSDGSLELLTLPVAETNEAYAGFDPKPITEMGFRLEGVEAAEEKKYNPLLPMDMVAFNLFVTIMFATVFALTLIVFGWYTFKVKVRQPARNTSSGV
jgi:hypothetical protein